ncbi:ribulose-5-phosphate 4-epimerase/fuculose-1-phosphate aldolase [Kerstersia gyiorum]|nr:ribulose-5-phosphate 4-epimerase/fuculose-1-phosphate aldolase [Kerstersia gyiorum]MCP1708636.1 ribulose-5-phosphate 4-epimerase/fuculose-1-phosphate aldolase [Kerstersia gyiorum]
MSNIYAPRPAEVDENEWRARVDLAACYRLVALYGWSDLIFTHISAKTMGGEPDQDDHEFLINPYGLMFDEITASSLVKVGMSGLPVDGSPAEIVNRAGFVIHSAVHEGRPDIACIIHTHTRVGIAVSAQPGGLLPISQQATLLTADLSYHDYEGGCRFR